MMGGVSPWLPVLLSEQELRAALEPLLDRLLIERLRYFQLQLEPRLQTSIAQVIAQVMAAHGVGRLGDERRLEAFTTGAERILAAEGIADIAAALLAASEAFLGEARSLLVTRRGETMVWKSERMRLPERFAGSDADTVLRAIHAGDAAGHASGEGRRELFPVRVRDTVIGWLCWEARVTMPPEARERLEALAQIAGLALLKAALGKAPRARRPAEITDGVKAAVHDEAASGGGVVIPTPAAAAGSGTKATAFAELLIEDLKLYLQREQGAALGQARREGRIELAFAAEIGRCRRAFLERFPGEGNGTFQAAVRQL